jgi:isoleucyl-tRNA synthetase
MKLIENYGYDNINIYMDNKFECGHLLDKRILNSSSRQNLIDDFKRGYDVFGLPIEKELREQQDLDFVNDNPLLKEKENVS